MTADLRRQVLTVLIFIVTIAVNGAAVGIPLGGKTTGELSDLYPVPIVPASYVFAIWSVIYTLLLAYTIYQALPGRREDPVLRRLGWLPALSGVLNALWVVLWQLQEAAPTVLLTVPVMVALLLTLIACWARMREPQAGPVPRGQGWLVALPFSVYLGWITVATIANVTQMLWTVLGRPETVVLGGPVWGAIILGVGLAIATPIVLRGRDVAYGIVIVWAYTGIVAKQTAAASPPEAAIAVAAAGAAWIAVCCLVVVVRAFPGARGAAATA